MATAQQMTTEDLARIEEPGRYDLIRGEIIHMPPAGGDHGEYASNIGGYVWTYVKQHKGIGKTSTAEPGFLLSRDPDTLLVPDFAFVSTERLPAKADCRGFMAVAPDLAIGFFPHWIATRGLLSRPSLTSKLEPDSSGSSNLTSRPSRLTLLISTPVSSEPTTPSTAAMSSQASSFRSP